MLNVSCETNVYLVDLQPMLATMLYVFWLLFLCFSLSRCKEAVDCTNKAVTSTMTRLKADLLCGYDKYVRPVDHNSNQTRVYFILVPRIIQFDEGRSAMHLSTWVGMNWMDSHLKWDKIQYDDISEIILDTNLVWTPDLHLYNSVDDISLDRLYAPVIVDNLGQVDTIYMSLKLFGHCKPDFTNWPYDTQVCSLTLGSKRYFGSIVDFKFYNDKDGGITMDHYLPNKDWSVVKTNTTRKVLSSPGSNETKPFYIVNLLYDFTLRRHATVYVATYVIPGFVMVVLSLGVLWIPPDKMERMAVLCALVILQTIFLQFLGFKLPSNGDTTPYLVCFYRDTLVPTCLLLFETLVTRSMLTWNTNPTYLQSTCQLVARNRVLRMIFVSDIDAKNPAELMEESTLLASDESVKHWRMFVQIINKSVFILLVPIYFLLSLSLLPLNYSVSIN